jgi:hypothetical protein
VLVVLNFGDETTVQISGAALDEVMSSSDGMFRDLLTGASVDLAVGATSAGAAMDAESALVLVPGDG